MLSRASSALAVLGLAALAVTCSDSSSPTTPRRTPASLPPAVLITPPPPQPPPGPVFHIRPDPATGPAPLLVNFNLCPAAGPVTDPAVFDFEFGDGEVLPGPPCRREHLYTRRGAFTAHMCITDHRGLECVDYLVRVN